MLVEIVPRAFNHTHHGEQYHHRFECLCQGRNVFAGSDPAVNSALRRELIPQLVTITTEVGW